MVNSKDELVDFEVKFKILNGVMSKIKPDDQEDVNMDDDNELIDKNEKFIKGLNVTEDIIKVLKYVYLD